MLDKLCLGMSYSVIGHELNVESTMYINKVSLNRKTHKTRLSVDQLMKWL